MEKKPAFKAKASAESVATFANYARRTADDALDSTASREPGDDAPRHL